ncbi:VOC family protein [Humisphaera borealis]|uniref:Uncharacterized protein n=1 Tax=Humisphaera borealis TaxID=2807512 RepID=A0A7M2WXU5_9BACT|nr:hypothetical protein [Humisphaera borealis]QOV90296.1 hypothetical protein IPV69_02680 [Humisphaera borealis]
MELADDSEPLKLQRDPRPILPEPPPVRLVAVDDVVLLTPPGKEPQLDAFYVGLLRMEREDQELPVRPPTAPILGDAAPNLPAARVRRPLPALPAGAIQGPVYRAEKHRVSFHVLEPLFERDSLRPLGVEVPSLTSTRLQIERLEIDYTRQKGLYAGQDSLLLKDPGGNWIEIMESRPI